MGRNVSNHSESPVRGRDSSRRRSPKRAQRSPARRRDSSPRREKNYRRSVSPKRTRSGSPSSQSPSPRTRRLRRTQDEKVYDRERHRNGSRGSDKKVRRSPEREKHSNNTKSPKRPESVSPNSRSPSPRTKRLKRAQADREVAEKVTKRDGDRSNGREGDRNSHREREYREKEREKDLEREIERDRRERRSRREEVDGKSSRPRHGRSGSPSGHRRRSRQRSQSPQPSDYDARDEGPNSRGSEQRNDDDDSVTKMKAAEEALQAKEKQKPSFELSGKLAAETNRVKGVTLLFNEPPDARKPDIRWRLYVFKGGEVLNEPLYIHRQTCYLFGRERRVADIPTDHPSCSKQHAVIQFRQAENENPDGTMSKQIKPYLMDLGSTNKTFLNDNPIEPQRYYELFEKDTIKFGNSSREYVLLHENSVQ